ncbi:Mu-like prophage major head subunit gpT family protein [Gimesia fumaroli]|uniref:Mu-like prophage major head subunit gpT n=1 Tax=Gimesia fumaroli TaxID=2527976 RepID=A0A518ICT2_9PLAN|nr:Mu-like prophage major head subunit gpT family protein [Gimesia fumaroli]QDV50849.1 Mu-like prophage major head subunit gpT [Gimesia fumaroli]
MSHSPTRGGVAKLGERGIRAFFYEGLQGLQKTGWVDRVSTLYDSDQEVEDYHGIGHVPAMRESRNGRNAEQLSHFNYEIRNVDFDATIRVKKHEMKRDKVGLIRKRVNELAGSSQKNWARLISNLQINGESAQCYDKKMYFAKNHQEGKSPVQSNLIDASDYLALNVADATDPTAAELMKVFMKCIQHLYSLKDDQNEPRNEDAMKFIAFVPISMWGESYTTITSKNLAVVGGGNQDNPLPDAEFSLEVVPNPRLTFESDLIVSIDDGSSYIRQEEEPLDLVILGEDSDHYYFNKEIMVSAESTRNVGYGLWSSSVKAQLS